MEDKVARLAEPAAAAADCEVWGVEIQGSGGNRVLRVFIDAEDGIAVEQCAMVSRQLSALLDVEEPISGHYLLEVSSPGMDRLLFTGDQVAESVGELVDVRLRFPLAGKRRYVGRLVSFEEEVLTLDLTDTGPAPKRERKSARKQSKSEPAGDKDKDEAATAVSLEWSNVAKARIVPEFG